MLDDLIPMLLVLLGLPALLAGALLVGGYVQENTDRLRIVAIQECIGRGQPALECRSAFTETSK